MLQTDKQTLLGTTVCTKSGRARKSGISRRTDTSAFASVSPDAGTRARRIVFDSRVMQELLKQAERAGESEAKVLITGESGVGKDVLAHHIHINSPRADGSSSFILKNQSPPSGSLFTMPGSSVSASFTAVTSPSAGA